jgi:hypothetical protein
VEGKNRIILKMAWFVDLAQDLIIHKKVEFVLSGKNPHLHLNASETVI